MTDINPHGLISPQDLRRIAEEKEMAALREILEKQRKQEAQQREVYEAFMNQHIHPDARQRFEKAVRDAAERGQSEIQLLLFSSDFCTDGGRAINNFEKDWPDSLTGIAREVYDAYEQHLRPLGYRLRAQVLNYPKGMPGDVGMFLHW